MLGMLRGRLFLVGKEENIIKASKEGEKDSKWYRLTFSNQARTFECTCGEHWKLEVSPGKVVDFDVSTLALMKELECTFDIEKDSKGLTKVKLRTFSSPNAKAQ